MLAIVVEAHKRQGSGSRSDVKGTPKRAVGQMSLVDVTGLMTKCLTTPVVCIIPEHRPRPSNLRQLTSVRPAVRKRGDITSLPVYYCYNRTPYKVEVVRDPT